MVVRSRPEKVGGAFAALILTCYALCVAQARTLDLQRDYRDFEVVRVFPKNIDDTRIIAYLQRELKFEFWRSPLANDKTAPLDLLLSPENEQAAKTLLQFVGIPFEVVLNNAQLTQRLAEHWQDVTSQGNAEFRIDKYHTYEEIEEWLQELAGREDIVTLIDIGRSWEGRPIYAVKISSARPGEKRNAIWMDAGIHADEWIGPSTMIYFIHQLVTRYGRDDEITNLVDKLDWYILPLFNVDGYIYTWTHDRLWRKTRSDHGNGCIGVDPNRNWDFKWEEHASRDPCSRTFHGPAAFSEPEVAAVSKFLGEHNDTIKAYLAYHSFSQFWMTPYAYTKDRQPYNIQELMSLSKQLVDVIQKVNGTKYIYGSVSELIGISCGSSIDYAYEVLNIKYAFGVELRDNGLYGTLLPSSQIIPTGRESFAAVKYLANYLVDQFPNISDVNDV